jgi:hypothetical protein
MARRTGPDIVDTIFRAVATDIASPRQQPSERSQFGPFDSDELISTSNLRRLRACILACWPRRRGEAVEVDAGFQTTSTGTSMRAANQRSGGARTGYLPINRVPQHPSHHRSTAAERQIHQVRAVGVDRWMGSGQADPALRCPGPTSLPPRHTPENMARALLTAVTRGVPSLPARGPLASVVRGDDRIVLRTDHGYSVRGRAEGRRCQS